MRQDRDSKGHGDHHVMMSFDSDGAGMHGMNPDNIPGLTADQRKKLKEDMDRAHAAIAQAMADSHQLMEQAHQKRAEAHTLSQQERDRIHQQVELAMQNAHAAMLAQNDGKVLMRCKLGPDGKATDCEQLGPGPTMMFRWRDGHRGYDHDGPMPPMPPVPPPPPPPG